MTACTAIPYRYLLIHYKLERIRFVVYLLLLSLWLTKECDIMPSYIWFVYFGRMIKSNTYSNNFIVLYNWKSLLKLYIGRYMPYILEPYILVPRKMYFTGEQTSTFIYELYILQQYNWIVFLWNCYISTVNFMFTFYYSYNYAYLRHCSISSSIFLDTNFHDTYYINFSENGFWKTLHNNC